MRRRTHHKRKFTIPLAIVAGFLPAALDIKKNVDNGQFGVLRSVQHTATGLIGWDDVQGKWVGLSQMKAAGAPGILAGFAAHWIANKVGINRMLARARIPLIRI